MGKAIMNQKKIISTLVIGITLISIATVIVPTIKAIDIYVVKGVLYINNTIAPAGIQINLIFTDGTENTTTYDFNIYGDTTNYNMVVLNRDKQTGNFTVLYLGYELEPIDNKSVYAQNGVIDYINLSVIVPVNHAPDIPSSPDPADDTTGVDRNKDLGWTGGDSDGDLVTYDVYFGTTNPPLKKSDNQSGTSYDPGTMNYDTKYYWQIIAWDNHGASTSGSIWSFTTKSSSPPPPPPPPPSGNEPPTADANGPYFGSPGTEIEFDGTGSHDNDEGGSSIVQYDWKFFDGDSWRNDIGATPTYTYTEAGTYTVTLRVHDDEGSTDEDTTTATIIAGNNPPTKPEFITKTTDGNKNTPYEYSVMSTDPDNDTIKYVFYWDDDTTNTTAYYTNGTECDAVTHMWTAAGVYNVKAEAIDENNASSGNTTLTVLIDAHAVKDIGYLIDENGDGVYDIFQNTAGDQTDTEKQADGTYLIDNNGDGNWDYIYDPDTDTLTAYTPEEGGGASEKAKADNTIWYALVIGMVIVILILIVIYLATKKKKRT